MSALLPSVLVLALGGCKVLTDDEIDELRETTPFSQPSIDTATTDDPEPTVDTGTTTDCADTPWYRDSDMDEWGDEDDVQTGCDPPDGYVAAAGDCADDNPYVNPGASEVCNDGLDNNCTDSRDGCGFYGDWSLSTADVAMSGDSHFGGRLAAADVTGDGIDDLMIRSSDHDGFRGAIRVFAGAPDFSPFSISSATLELTGQAANETLGRQIGVGDFNGDGQDDLALGTNWPVDASYVFYGPLLQSMSTDAADVEVLQGDDTYMASVGDIDGDGDDELAVGDYYAQSSDRWQNGIVYLIHADLQASFEPATLADSTIHGTWNGGELGRQVEPLGDLNNDGLDDFAVLEVGWGGAVFVHYGDHTGDWDAPSSSRSAIDGDDSDTIDGVVAVDFDGDGLPDVAVKNPGWDDATHGEDVGAVSIYLSPLELVHSFSSPDTMIVGTEPQIDFANAMTSGELNGDDGGEELVVGANDSDLGGTDAGAFYVFDGQASPPAVRYADDYWGRWVGHLPDKHAGTALTVGDFNHDGLEDVGVGADAFGNGYAFVVLGGGL